MTRAVRVHQSVQSGRQGMAKPPELLLQSPHEETGPQVGWSFCHHQGHLPCCHQTASLHERSTSTPTSLMRLQNVPSLHSLAQSPLMTKRNMRLRKSWTPGSGGANFGTSSNS